MRAPYGEGRDVVVELSAAVVEQGPVKPVQQLAGRRRALPSHPVRQGEEFAGAVPGLRYAVGVEQQLVARGEGDGVDVVVVPDQCREIEGR